MRLATLLFCALALPPAASGQSSEGATSVAAAADVASPDAILEALYASISGPAGQPRDWPRFLSLFYDGARLMPTAPLQSGGDTALVWSPQDYVARSGAGLVASGFSESETGRQMQEYGPVLHAFSAYEGSYTRADGEQQGVSGINSIQLFHDGNRWWIMSVFWAVENESRPLPHWARD